MENKQQTAVEWLVGRLNQKVEYIPLDKWDMIRDIVQQAKEMEKDQIKNAYLFGLIHPLENEATKQAEQFYNETYSRHQEDDNGNL